MPQDCRDHGPVVEAANEALRTLARELDLGKYHFPPTWFTEVATGLSTEPDGFLVLWETLGTGRFTIDPIRRSEYLGHPDMTLEVVSRGSKRKDLERLVEDYADAGVREYWIVDAREPEVRFRILVLGPDGTYRDQPAGEDGWIASPLWGRSFRFVRFVGRVGQPDVRLEVSGPRG